MYINSIGTTNMLKTAWNNINKTTNQLSSMDRIPSANYDPAGLAISERFKSQYNEQEMRMNNLAMEINSDMTAESALGSITDSVQRINELSVQASNGTLTSQDREIIQQEINSLKAGIDDVAANTTFNDKQVIAGFSSDNLGLNSVNVVGDSATAITAAKDAIDTLSSARADLGGRINTTEKSINNLQTQSFNSQNAYNAIRGLDVAQAMVDLTKDQMLFSAGLSMLNTQKEMSGQLLSLVAG